jgi:hypothetical protein
MVVSRASEKLLRCRRAPSVIAVYREDGGLIGA